MKACPICENSGVFENYMQFNYASKEYILVKCRECTGIFYENEFFFDFKENYEHNRSLRVYLEKTSDIETGITVLHNFLSLYSDRTHTGLDIGCGAGLLMDFSETMMSKKMIGFEPSSHFSKEGNTTLGLNIIEDFFSPGALEGK